MLAFEATSQISASKEQVWKVLVDGAKWSAWDSGVDGVDGTIALGEKLRIRSAAAPGRTFPVKVTTFSQPDRLVFTGGMPFGLFRGVRTYTLSDDGSGTSIRMREEYSGPMAGAIGKSIPDLNPSFVQFVTGLKARVESSS